MQKQHAAILVPPPQNQKNNARFADVSKTLKAVVVADNTDYIKCVPMCLATVLEWMAQMTEP